LPEQRGIRSYVLRQGRVSNAQRRSLDTLLPVYGIAYAPAPLDLNAVFGRSAPKILEIGFGMGETTANIAAAHPENDYLAIEVHSPGVGGLLKLIDEQRLTNIRIIQHDVVDILNHMLPAESLAGVHIFFPDPWPKKRHHKRRLVQPPMMALIASRMEHGAYLHLATDWKEYAEQMLQVLGAEPTLQNTSADFAPRPESRPQTKFEARGLRLGHEVWDLVFRKR
jgi:tRNA (guanine-N7-)-methyltransferase